MTERHKVVYHLIASLMGDVDVGLEGKRHNRHTIVADFGCSPATADRWIREIADTIPGMYLTKEGAFTWIAHICKCPHPRVPTRRTSMPPRGLS